jgi:hypothetical protein
MPQTLSTQDKQLLERAGGPPEQGRQPPRYWDLLDLGLVEQVNVGEGHVWYALTPAGRAALERGWA